MDRLPFYAIFEKPVPLDLLRLQRVIDTPSTSSSARFTKVLVCSLWHVIDRTALPQRRKVFSIFGAQLMLLVRFLFGTIVLQVAYRPRGVGPPPGHGLCPEWRVFFFQTRENRTNTQPFTELEPIWFAYVSGSTIRSAHDDRNIRGTPLVHMYGWQLKDDMYLVGGNGSCAIVWCFVIVSGQVNQQCSCQTTVFDIHCKPRGWRPRSVDPRFLPI
ncbi:hypothetical protein SCLCIDRAFT_930007 [Scleroderma citrinum Foug A]|uniref:Uncharacterized protein n=1 Tax=Scleroderma citrinum Foug A TaxID=1036808 RepID=A0A0C3DX94_9AGAM|nr:hypothetical protein SCLCIDRAFT_930007 [Scleroderma citrinum Foug A]